MPPPSPSFSPERATPADLAVLREVTDDVMCTYHPFHSKAASALLFQSNPDFPIAAIAIEVRAALPLTHARVHSAALFPHAPPHPRPIVRTFLTPLPPSAP